MPEVTYSIPSRLQARSEAKIESLKPLRSAPVCA
jgi:hypothetical protein